jgi:hypothetical protein
MAIDLATSPGGLFVRWGKMIGGINESLTAVGATADSRAVALAAQFVSNQQQVIDGLFGQRDSFHAAAGDYCGYLRDLMSTTLIEMAADDGIGLVSNDLPTALDKLISQMATTVDSINKPTVAATATAGGSNHGNGTFLVSLIDPIDGLQADYVFGETLIATCTDDGFQGGGATQGQEPFSILGQIAADSDLSWDWPNGSGAATATNVIDPAVTGQIVVDGSFEAWEGAGDDTPTNWSLIVATAGTTLVRGEDPYRGAYNLRFIGDGSQLTTVRQTIDVTNLAPLTSYAVNCYLKTDGSVAAGVLQIRLVDGSNTVISDAAGTANSMSKTISTLTSSYTAFSEFFRTPAVLPTTVKVEIALTTAMTNTEILDIDDLQIVAADLLYAGGPRVKIFAGSTPFAKNDTVSLAVTNSLGVTSFARSLDRTLGLRELGKKIPSAASETISDSLIS